MTGWRLYISHSKWSLMSFKLNLFATDSLGNDEQELNKAVVIQML